MKRIWSYIRYFLRTQKDWRLPRSSPVLIFDDCNQDVILEYLRPWKPEILHVRGESINMLIFFASLLKGGKFLSAYVDCFIERVNPTLIVTFIDNNKFFYTISQRHPKVKTLFIQNGWRSYYSDIFEELDKISAGHQRVLTVDRMLLFGSVIGSKYSQYIPGSVVKMGSIKNNLVPRNLPSQLGLISFVSQWVKHGVRMDGVFYTQEEFCGHMDRAIIKFLENYVRTKHKRLAIILRNYEQSDARAEEEAYFREKLGNDCVFQEPFGRYPSYNALDAAEVVVAIDTTLGYESIARGNKTAIFSVRGSLLGISGLSYGWPGDFPDEGPFWTNHLDSNAFIRILDYLFEVDDTKWREDVRATNFSSLMIYNPGNSILKSLLEKELDPFPIQQF